MERKKKRKDGDARGRLVTKAPTPQIAGSIKTSYYFGGLGRTVHSVEYGTVSFHPGGRVGD